MVNRKIASAVVAALLASVSIGSLAADGVYKVSARLSYHGKVFGSPVMTLKGGQQGSIEVSDPENVEDDFKLTLTLVDAGDGNLNIATELESAHGNVSPLLSVPRGETAMVSVGDIQIDMKADYMTDEAFREYRASLLRGKAPTAPL